MTDLASWTFKLNPDAAEAPEHDCFSCGAFTFALFAQSVAEWNAQISWDDLEERAHFLTQLWTFCQEQGFDFPLKEKINEQRAEKLTS